ncbi:MAG: hypothetical protein ABJK64_16385 [Paraglaciecola sp.]|uniref:hypothetical protein n=1 Tax=Paraglaciecola sp. TaxID=1920173 RepID=UPI003299982E
MKMTYLEDNPKGYSIEKWDCLDLINKSQQYLFDQIACHSEKQFSKKIIYERKQNNNLPALVADSFMNSHLFAEIMSSKSLVEFSASLLKCTTKDVVIAFPHFRLDLPTNFTEDQVRLNLPWHQEAGYFLEKGNCSIKSLVVSTPIFNCTEADGALVVDPFSHIDGLTKHNSVFMDKTNKRHKRVICAAPKNYEVLETLQGESQVISFLTKHRSGINKNSGVRCTLLFRISDKNDLM